MYTCKLLCFAVSFRVVLLFYASTVRVLWLCLCAAWLKAVKLLGVLPVSNCASLCVCGTCYGNVTANFIEIKATTLTKLPLLKMRWWHMLYIDVERKTRSDAVFIRRPTSSLFLCSPSPTIFAHNFSYTLPWHVPVVSYHRHKWSLHTQPLLSFSLDRVHSPITGVPSSAIRSSGSCKRLVLLCVSVSWSVQTLQFNQRTAW